MADFKLEYHGSIALLIPTSKAGHAWTAEHLPEDAMRWGKCSYMIEPRYLEDIVDGVSADGLSFS